MYIFVIFQPVHIFLLPIFDIIRIATWYSLAPLRSLWQNNVPLDRLPEQPLPDKCHISDNFFVVFLLCCHCSSSPPRALWNLMIVAFAQDNKHGGPFKLFAFDSHAIPSFVFFHVIKKQPLLSLFIHCLILSMFVLFRNRSHLTSPALRQSY